MEPGLRLKMTLYLEPDLARAVTEDARKRHLPQTRAAADAIRRALLDERPEGLADTIKMRLDRLEKREVVRAREMAILKEALLLYVRVWLEHTPPPEEELSDLASLSADQRFAEFLDLLSESLEPGRNLFDEATLGAAPYDGRTERPATGEKSERAARANPFSDQNSDASFYESPDFGFEEAAAPEDEAFESGAFPDGAPE